ncbi:hypothetical protein EJ110_NYTH32082 [Nymphaea thermarum]|nr:hypothetical protein EJ110_NYTH32082 [Nymphaea thermarum]
MVQCFCVVENGNDIVELPVSSSSQLLLKILEYFIPETKLSVNNLLTASSSMGGVGDPFNIWAIDCSALAFWVAATKVCLPSPVLQKFIFMSTKSQITSPRLRNHCMPNTRSAPAMANVINSMEI